MIPPSYKIFRYQKQQRLLYEIFRHCETKKNCDNRLYGLLICLQMGSADFELFSDGLFLLQKSR